MLFRETVAVYCENHTEHTDTLCGENVEFYCVKAGGVRRGADKSLAFPISYFHICSTTKIIFLGWVKEVRTMNS
jgi:hypothetical protein